MYDNGLLKFYKKYARKDGYLKSKRCGLKLVANDGEDPSLDIIKTPTGRIFCKHLSLEREHNAEVLLSQIYQQVGLNSAIYTPILAQKNQTFVASNDVSDSTTMIGGKFFSSMAIAEGIRKKDTYIPVRKEDNKLDYSKYFTKQAMEEYLKMRLFDCASVNGDRNDTNYFFSVQDGKAVQLRTFDHGFSGYASPKYIDTDYYYTNFTGHNKCVGDNTREEILFHFKNSENILDYVSPASLAEELGSVDVMAVKQDIKQTIGYEIDQSYADMIATSYDYVANELVK